MPVYRHTRNLYAEIEEPAGIGMTSELEEADKSKGDSAVSLANRLSADLTPLTFEVCFAYIEHREPAINSLIDDFLDAGRSVSQDTFQQLHDKYLSTTDEALTMEEIGGSYQLELNQMVDELAFAGQKSQEFEDKLVEGVERMEALNDPAAKEAVDDLLAATREMKETNHKLGTRLEDSASMVNGLRQRLEQMRYENMTDDLTMLPNRKAFDIDLTMALKRAQKEEEPLVLLMADLDYFGNFNERWGKQMGDMVLKLVAESIRKFQAGDIKACRFGGEEFVIVAPHMTMHEGERLAERIREWIAGKRIVRKATGEEIGNVTVSFGVARCHSDDSLNDLIERTEQALFAAKNAGRNCTKTLDN